MLSACRPSCCSLCQLCRASLHLNCACVLRSMVRSYKGPDSDKHQAHQGSIP